MPSKSPLNPPVADVVYHYDGSLAGFYCCAYESVYAHEMPLVIYPQHEALPTFYTQKYIETDFAKAAKVEQSIDKKISPEAKEWVQTVFLSCLAQKEIAMLQFLLLGYKCGKNITSMFGNEIVAKVFSARKHLYSEQHLLTGFVRFTDYDGVLAATITPKNFVLPFLKPHFIQRFPNENFMIYDKTHKAALIYENKKATVQPLQSIEFPQISEKENNYHLLWKRFFKTISIEARCNPLCQMTNMPKRYWANMLEMQD